MTYQWDPADPQKVQAYAAQSEVARAHPEYDLSNLRAVQSYVEKIRASEGVSVDGPFRAWQFQGGADQLIIDRPRKLGIAAGRTVYIPAFGTRVYLLPWPRRTSHYEVDASGRGEITVGGPVNGPLSHRLLILHEFAHINRYHEKHGPVWATAFREITRRYLPAIVDELIAALGANGVQCA